MELIADGLWRWTARHPEWHPGEFGAEVASFAAADGAGAAGGALLLVDPLLPEDGDAERGVLDTIDAQLGDRLAILITIPYHVRSAEELWRRYRKRADTTIHGHPAAARRLEDTTAFRVMRPEDELPGGVSAHRIGKPRRYETPLHLPAQRALVFGDAVAETGGRLVVWSDRRVDEGVERFYRERFNPTLEPLLELDFDAVLVTHGEPLLRGGKEALAAALAAEPWYHHA